LVQTVDVFTPSVDDPYTFGQVAAANSVSDINDFLKALHNKGVRAAAVIGKGSGVVHIKTDGSRKIPSPKSTKPAKEFAQVKQQSQQAPAEPQAEEVLCCADAVTSAGPGTEEGSARPGDSTELVEGSPKSDIAQIKVKFTDCLGSASSSHGLDAYTKQAMAIALSVATRCEPCLKMHLKKVRKKASPRMRSMRPPGWPSASPAHRLWSFTNSSRTLNTYDS